MSQLDAKRNVAWQYDRPAAEDPLVVGAVRANAYTVAARFHAVATHRVRRLGAFDLDTTRLTWAEQTAVKGQTLNPPVRLVAVPVSATPSGGVG